MRSAPIDEHRVRRLCREKSNFLDDMAGFFMADTFVEAAARLPKDVLAKVAKALKFLSRDPRHPSLNYESLRRDSLFSFRVDQQYRVILRQMGRVPALLYVGNHDDAYRFAARTPEWRTEPPFEPFVEEPLFSLERISKPSSAQEDVVVEVFVNGRSQGIRSTKGLSLRRFAELQASEHGIRTFSVRVDGTEIDSPQADISLEGVSRVEIVAIDRRGAGVEVPLISYRLSTAPAPPEMIGTLIRTRKYLPLAHFLLSTPPQTATLELSFADVERIITDNLPASAHEYDAWWRATDHSQASAWLAVGWKVSHVSRDRQKVTFERIGGESHQTAVTGG